MKRKGLIIAATSLSLLLSACGSAEAPAPAENPVTDTAGAATESSALETKTEEVSETAETSDETTEDSGEVTSPKFLSDSKFLYESDSSGKYEQPIIQGHIESIKLSEDSRKMYPELASSIDSYIKTMTDNASSQADMFTSDNKEARASIAADDTAPFIYTATLSQDFFIERADTEVVSILSCLDSYAGGAHGFAMYTSETFDSRTGKELTLPEVVPDKAAFKDALLSSLENNYDKDVFFCNDPGMGTGLSDELDKYLKTEYEPENLNPDENDVVSRFYWALDYKGVNVYFNAYDIAPYAAGTITAFIPYRSGLVDAAYAPLDDSAIISEQPLYMDIRTTEGDDNKMYNYGCFFTTYEDDFNMYKSFEVFSDTDKETVEDDFFSFTEYLTKVGSKQYFIVVASSYSDLDYFYIFDLDNGNITQKDMLPCDHLGSLYEESTNTYYASCLTDSSNMSLSKRFDLLSTYSANKTYRLGEDGTLTSDNKYFDVHSHFTLKTKAEITGELISKDNESATEGSGKDIAFPSGTKFTIIRTDGTDKVDMLSIDGTLARFTLETPDGENGFYNHLNGRSIEELFEELYFAS